MEEDLEDLKRRLVVGHKRDGRSVVPPASRIVARSGNDIVAVEVQARLPNGVAIDLRSVELHSPP